MKRSQLEHPNYEIAATIRIKFIDGETLDSSFHEYKAAMEFYHRAQKRHDVFTAQFLDADLHFPKDRGYASQARTDTALGQQSFNF